MDKKLRSAGYFLEPGQAPGPMSDIWLYSCKLEGKSVKHRARFELTFDMYRDILNVKHSELYQQLNKDDSDLLGTLYYRYDNERESLDPTEKQGLSLLLLQFALANKLNHTHEIKPGMHFIILDIPSDDGYGLCGFAVVDHPGILTNEEVLEATEIFLDRANIT